VGVPGGGGGWFGLVLRKGKGKSDQRKARTENRNCGERKRGVSPQKRKKKTHRKTVFFWEKKRGGGQCPKSPGCKNPSNSGQTMNEPFEMLPGPKAKENPLEKGEGY